MPIQINISIFSDPNLPLIIALLSLIVTVIGVIITVNVSKYHWMILFYWSNKETISNRLLRLLSSEYKIDDLSSNSLYRTLFFVHNWGTKQINPNDFQRHITVSYNLEEINILDVKVYSDNEYFRYEVEVNTPHPQTTD